MCKYKFISGNVTFTTKRCLNKTHDITRPIPRKISTTSLESDNLSALALEMQLSEIYKEDHPLRQFIVTNTDSDGIISEEEGKLGATDSIHCYFGVKVRLGWLSVLYYSQHPALNAFWLFGFNLWSKTIVLNHWTY